MLGDPVGGQRLERRQRLAARALLHASKKKRRTSSGEGANMGRFSRPRSIGLERRRRIHRARRPVGAANGPIASQGRPPAHLMNVTTEQLFDQARTHNGFTAEPVPEAQLRQLYDLMKWGPTSANSRPGADRLRDARRGQGELLDCVSPGNVEKTRQAPVTAIIGMDMEFHEKLPHAVPACRREVVVRSASQRFIDATAFRNSSLQGGYFILAARALGLDCGPMSGFDAAKVDAAFWAGTRSRPTSSATSAMATRPSSSRAARG